MLTFKRTKRLHHFCAQWDSTCSSLRAPPPKFLVKNTLC